MVSADQQQPQPLGVGIPRQKGEHLRGVIDVAEAEGPRGLAFYGGLGNLKECFEGTGSVYRVDAYSGLYLAIGRCDTVLLVRCACPLGFTSL